MFGSTATRLHAKVLSLDGLRANVMLADNKLNITFVNRALAAFLKRVEPDIRKEMPRFSVSSLVGCNIDVFHKQPAHQRGMLAKMQKPHSATIEVAGQKFELHIVPLLAGGRRVGYSVEWLDAAERALNLEYRQQFAAIERSQAVIEFTAEGIIRRANDKFLQLTGYRLDEILGKHHRIFLDPAESGTPAYEKFWQNLRAGQFQAGEFKRFGKSGKAIWIRGSYDPIQEADGSVSRIIKYALDVTDRVQAVNGIGSGLRELAGKNLQYRLSEAFTPEFEPLRLDFNSSLDNLKQTMTAIATNTRGVRGGAGEITQASDDLSRRTEQQAATLEQTAAALDQITTTIQRTAENAGKARDVVTSAKSDAEQSREVVGKTVSAMTEIENSAKKIGNIINVIDEIAFQTNLLALNAGVEAARAGDAGRGFAVVATEVRALAQRSADAAKEIKSLISTSGQQVDIGVNLVGETGKALVSIGERVATLADLVGEIAASAQEQAAGLNQVNTAVNQMDQVTQQNAAMVEESTAASHSLTAEAEELHRLLSQFKIGEAPKLGLVAASPKTPPNAAPKTSTKIPPKTAPKPTPRRIPPPPAQEKQKRVVSNENWNEF